MSGFKRALVLAMACALMLSAARGATAAATSYLTGTWSGSNAYYGMTITLYDDGRYTTTIDQGGQSYQNEGSYQADASYIYFWPNGAAQSTLSYHLSGDTLTLTEWNTGDAMTLTRQQAPLSRPSSPPPPAVPEGLAGSWTGEDKEGLFFAALGADGRITLAFDTPEPIDKTGTFTAAGGRLEAAFQDGTAASFQFLLTGNTLILVSEGEDSETITLTRQAPPAPPTPPPAPEATAAPLVPEITPPPAPTQAPALAEQPAVSEALAPTEAPSEPSLAGAWQEAGSAGGKTLTLTPEGGIEISREQGAADRRTGTYLADGSTLTANFEDGTTETFRYILMGDTLLLTDAQLENPMTMTRLAPPVQAEPAVDPALIGTWGGMDGEYGEMTIKETGEMDLMIPSDPSRCATYPYKISQGRISFLVGEDPIEGAYAVEGEALTITFSDGPVAYAKKTGPLVRQQMPEQPSGATVDAALTGTWGSLEGDQYEEITLYGDGTYIKFVPQEDLSVKGTYMAAGGNLAVLLPDGALQGKYAMEAEELTVTWQGAEPAKYLRQPGPLTRQAGN